MRLAALVLVASAALVGCAAPTLGSPSAELAGVVADVWGLDTAPRDELVAWQVGIPGPIHWAAATDTRCIGPLCWSVITVRADAINRETIAHEGGHVICHRRGDWSESCAVSEAEKVLQ